MTLVLILALAINAAPQGNQGPRAKAEILYPSEGIAPNNGPAVAAPRHNVESQLYKSILCPSGNTICAPTFGSPICPSGFWIAQEILQRNRHNVVVKRTWWVGCLSDRSGR